MQKSVKKNSVVTHEVRDAGNVLVIKVIGSDEIVFDRKNVSQECDSHAAIHGWFQRLSDAAALDKGSTPAQKYEAIRELADYYQTGATEWKRKSVGGGGGSRFDEGLCVTAMCNVLTGGDLDKCEVLIAATMAKREVDRTAALKVWAATEQVAGEMQRIKDAKAAPKMDANDLLTEFAAAEESDGETEESDETTTV